MYSGRKTALNQLTNHHGRHWQWLSPCAHICVDFLQQPFKPNAVRSCSLSDTFQTKVLLQSSQITSNAVVVKLTGWGRVALWMTGMVRFGGMTFGRQFAPFLPHTPLYAWLSRLMTSLAAPHVALIYCLISWEQHLLPLARLLVTCVEQRWLLATNLDLSSPPPPPSSSSLHDYPNSWCPHDSPG